jgi:DNA-binding transcriptional LysR family regulator
MTLSLVELQVLSGLAEGKTLASIGRELVLGQPSISRILHGAEKRVGIQLAQRQGHRLSLTPAGLELARMAQTVVAQLRVTDQFVEDMRSAQGGPLRLITTYLPGNYALSAAIGEFWRRVPDARVAVRVLSDPDIAGAFLHEAYDLGVGPPGLYTEGLLLEPLYDDPVVFFVASSSPLARQQVLERTDLHAQPVIGSFSDPYWSPLFEELRRRGLAVEHPVDLRATEGVKRLVRAGCGVGVSLQSALHEELASGEFMALQLAEPTVSAPYFLIRRSNTSLSPIARRFRSFLLQWFGHEDAMPLMPA